MRKIIALVAAMMLMAVPALASAEISVFSREDGSGTRGAFIELFGVLGENEAGEDVDNTTVEANITNATSVMISSVSGDPNAVGYVSLGSLDDTVKALSVDGAPATVEAIKAGEYKISRPFNIAVREGVSESAQDFINFILSAEGQAIAEAEGYIAAVEAAPAYAAGTISAKVVVAGSSSVTPLMEKLKEAYVALNAAADIEIQLSDSSIGMQSTIDGICDIGMASRELKDTELAAGLTPTAIAIDGIAVIVNLENALDNVAADSVRAIFTGEVTDWANVK